MKFLSTLSLRRATMSSHFILLPLNFYPRSPCGERQSKNNMKEYIKIFLSTLSLRRATKLVHECPRISVNFYPRSPCGERPGFPRSRTVSVWISIHALLAESDAGFHMRCSMRLEFLSTLSLRRATERDGKRREYTPISIHALLAESDENSPKGRR